MRLLDTKSFQLREFEGSEVPPYAIFSHCWGEAEILFHDIQDLHRARRKAGFSKIKRCCEEARQLGYSWVWIDTCCIDKSSSAELSEAINSMYNWYRFAGTCFVYMDDVAASYNVHRQSSRFRRSRWFTRGWTLQELLAPKHVVFFSNTWSHLGTKSCLVQELHEITKIPVEALLSDTQIHSFSVAQRMSWAATRQTTRVEDRAYSLMGLFDIFMPIIYGEGSAAFTRLQLEIIQRSNDQTIFAWSDVKPKVKICRELKLTGHEAYEREEYSFSRSSVLAISPAGFEHSGHIVHLKLTSVSFGKTDFSSTNIGIRICVPLVPMQLEDGEAFLWVLPCLDQAKGFVCGVLLRSDTPSLDLFHSYGWQPLFFLRNQLQDRLVRIPEREYNGLGKHVKLQTIYISDDRHSYHREPTYTKPLPFRHGGHVRVLVILGKPILLSLHDNGYFFTGCASRPDKKHWSAGFNAGGDLLVECRLDMEDLWKLYYQEYSLGVVSSHKKCITFHVSHAHVLFRSRHEKKLALSLLLANRRSPGGVRNLLIEVAKHSNDRINVREVCGQYNRGREVETSIKTEYNSVERIEYMTFWIKASSFLDGLFDKAAPRNSKIHNRPTVIPIPKTTSKGRESSSRPIVTQSRRGAGGGAETVLNHRPVPEDGRDEDGRIQEKRSL